MPKNPSYTGMVAAAIFKGQQELHGKGSRSKGVTLPMIKTFLTEHFGVKMSKLNKAKLKESLRQLEEADELYKPTGGSWRLPSGDSYAFAKENMKMNNIDINTGETMKKKKKATTVKKTAGAKRKRGAASTTTTKKKTAQAKKKRKVKAAKADENEAASESESEAAESGAEAESEAESEVESEVE
jgi:hypothetical protein